MATAPYHPPPPNPPHASLGNAPPKPPTLRRSTNISKRPNKFGFPMFTSLDSVIIPTYSSQATKETYWYDATPYELRALEPNHTWEAAPRPANSFIIGNK